MSLRTVWQIMKFGGRMMIDPIGTGEALADETLGEDDAPRPRITAQKKADEAKADDNKK